MFKSYFSQNFTIRLRMICLQHYSRWVAW